MSNTRKNIRAIKQDWLIMTQHWSLLMREMTGQSMAVSSLSPGKTAYDPSWMIRNTTIRAGAFFFARAGTANLEVLVQVLSGAERLGWIKKGTNTTWRACGLLNSQHGLSDLLRKARPCRNPMKSSEISWNPLKSGREKHEILEIRSLKKRNVI